VPPPPSAPRFSPCGSTRPPPRRSLLSPHTVAGARAELPHRRAWRPARRSLAGEHGGPRGDPRPSMEVASASASAPISLPRACPPRPWRRPGRSSSTATHARQRRCSSVGHGGILLVIKPNCRGNSVTVGAGVRRSRGKLYFSAPSPGLRSRERECRLIRVGSCFFSAFGRASPKTDSEAAQESLPNAPLVYRSSTMAVSDLLYCSISIALAQFHI
jgi:hypothetical protein